MALEIELKFLDINQTEIIRKLQELGAQQKYQTTLHNATFESAMVSPRDSSKQFLRVRKIDDTVFLTYKAPAQDSSLTIREEIEMTVDHFENTIKIFETLGFRAIRYTKKRTHFELGKIHFEIDEWGFIPPFLEIETHSKEDMVHICQRLGLTINEGRKGMITEIYPEKFLERP